MKRQQFILTGIGLLVLVLFYFFGETVPSKKNLPASAKSAASTTEKSIDADDILKASRARLTPEQQAYVTKLENAVVRGDVRAQQLKAYHQLADFYKDSVENAFLPAAYYIGEAAKLENSEKSLTFAAQLFLENVRGQDDPALKSWMAGESKGLFEKALQLDPNNDSLKIGLGGSYIFGSAKGNPQDIMQGIQQILEVARRDTNNMYAQYMLGLGGLESGQLDKAIERLTRVAAHQPANLEVILTVADAYERKGDKTAAIKWYEAAKKLITNAEVTKEIDQRIKLLQ